MTPKLHRRDGSAVWVPETTVAVLDRAVRERPHTVAMVAGELALTYSEYGCAVDRLASRLALAGERGGTVAIILHNMAATAIAMFAAQKAGRVAATLNPDYTAAELRPLLSDAAPCAVIAIPAVLERLGNAVASDVLVLPVEDDLSFLASLSGNAALELEPPRPNDLATLQFTGGTTGRAKGVELTHRAVATNIAQREAVLPTQFGDERVLCFMPMFHSFAAAMCVHLAAYTAGTLVILPRYRPDWVVEAIASHAVTRLPAGPTVFNGLVGYEGLTREGTRSLRCAYSGSAPLAAETLTRWEALTGVPIFEGYGQSEAGPILTYYGPGMAVKPGAVGPPLPLTELRIAAPAGDAGEVLTRGPQIMRGYRGLPEETAAALEDGWLHTGDIGRIDENGDLHIADRKKDMVLVSGYNVFPREVDEALMAHPQVAAAACVGVPDSYRGERLVAFVVPREGGAVCAEACAKWLEQRLVRYKQPAEYRFTNALPQTAARKIDKQALKVLAMEEARDVA